MYVSILIPVYNGAKTIQDVVRKVDRVLKDEKLQFILVNDGSPDNSHEVCLSLCKEYRGKICYVRLAKNFGEHNAVMAGLHHVKGDYVVVMDDDFQNPPEEVPALLKEAAEYSYDAVYTFYEKTRQPLLRRLGSRFNNQVANVLLDKPKDLYLSSFKCMSHFAVQEIVKYNGPYPYIDGLLLRCTRNIGKIQVRHEDRKEGASGYTFRKLVHLWLNMFVNFSVTPLRISSLIGLALNIAGLILGIVVVLDKLEHPDTPVGWPSLIIAIIVFSGVQLVMLGLIGEYLGKLFLSTNQTPQFVVRDIHE